MNTAKKFSKPLNQLLLLEQRVRLSGASLPESIESRARLNAIKCQINSTRCIVDMDAVSEVLIDKTFTKIPGCASWVAGVINLRGNLIPVYNLREFFGSTNTKRSIRVRKNPIILVRKGNVYFGVLVDKVEGMKKFFVDEFADIENADKTIYEFAHYIQSEISIDTKKWKKVDLDSLVDSLSQQDPSIGNIKDKENS